MIAAETIRRMISRPPVRPPAQLRPHQRVVRQRPVAGAVQDYRAPHRILRPLELADDLAQADDGEAVRPPFKLTAGQYFYLDPAGNYDGRDLNLRYRREDTSAWIGYYRDRQFGEQARIGFDTAWQPLASVPISVLPSLQAAAFTVADRAPGLRRV